MNAINRKGASLLEGILRENAIQADGTYLCLARDRYLAGRSDVNALKIAEGRRKPSAYPLFSGPFLKGDADSKDRLTLGRFQIFTFEYDVANDADFFAEQVGWALPVKDVAASRYGKLHALLSGKFTDFHLLSVVWSGNKSFHIHVVFDTTMFRDRGGAPDITSLHAGHHAHWTMLAADVEAILAPSRDILPDDNLSWQTAFRRTPDGLRKVDKPGHPLGLGVGSRVHQLVVWEKASLRKSPEVDGLLFSPTRYPTSLMPAQTTGSGAAASIAHPRSALSAAQVRHVESHLAAHFATSTCEIEFSHLEMVAETYRAKLRNRPSDVTPSSYIHEDFCTPRLVGGDADRIDVATIPPLPLPLGQMITVWCSELDQTSEFDAGALEAAYARLDRDLPPRLLFGAPSVLIHAPEGIRKSSSVMRMIHLSTVRGERGRPSMFACSSYRNAREKAREFNFPDHANPGNHRQDGFIGIYWPSSAQLYRDTADELRMPRLQHADADEAGFNNLWALVAQDQPAVMESMRQWHAATVTEMAGKNVVLFTAHEVAFRWRDNSMTRRLLARDAFEPSFDRAAAHASSRLNWLIVDEIAYPMFVDTFSGHQMEWLRKLRDHSPKIWSGRASERQREHFANHIGAMGSDAGLDIFQVQRAMQRGLDTFLPITVHDSTEYPPRGEADDGDNGGKSRSKPYACEGETYFVRARDWWRDGDFRVAETVIMTTTEIVPAMVAREVMTAASGECSAQTHEADPYDTAPGLLDYRPNFRLGRDFVEVYASGKVLAKKAEELTSDYHGDPDIHIISNKLGEIKNATSHHEARGANELAGKDIVQIVTMFPPSQYKELRALGSWIGRDDMVRLAHIDQINQACGRNRGPRNRGKRHLIKINLTLFRLLNACPSAMKELRYAFRTTVDAGQKSNKNKVRRR
ncbi:MULTISPECIES: hypothetical protein [unclassified Novosphingobium]|uniref:hypothetical protein n=1 Tax=unclassified Novosphingobium TaxID=2644732 RepID=UPI00135925CB|nr:MULTISPECIES: hypothetical protein [unclassified Novosphingobium]